MLNNERERIRHLNKELTSYDIHLENFLREDYQAVVLHSSSSIITANQAASDLLGYTVEELEGMNAWNLFPPQSAAVVTEHLHNQSEQPYRVDVRLKNGKLQRMELCGINFKLAGDPIRAILFKLINA